MTEPNGVPELDEPGPAPLGDDDTDERGRLDIGFAAEPPHPVNWNLLTADEARDEWAELDKWVTWLRRTYGLPTDVIPPFWHRHPELVWQLSALHLHWLCAYDPEQNGSAPLGWHRDFADARQRLRDWVASSGTRLDRDRPTRQTAWPGEQLFLMATLTYREAARTVRRSVFTIKRWRRSGMPISWEQRDGSGGASSMKTCCSRPSAIAQMRDPRISTGCAG